MLIFVLSRLLLVLVFWLWRHFIQVLVAAVEIFSTQPHCSEFLLGYSLPGSSHHARPALHLWIQLCPGV
jgi:hypothetical protein